MSIPFKIKIAAAVIMLAISSAAVIAIVSLRKQVASAQMGELNAKAIADSTRSVELSRKDSVRLLGDSLRAVERLAVQQRIEPDAMDRALKRQTEALVAATATIARLSSVISSSSPVSSSSGDSVRRAKFHERSEPYTLDAEATLPLNGLAQLSYTIALDTAHIELRLGCSAAERGKLVRAATATAITDRWLKLSLSKVQQSEEVCRNAQIARARKLTVRPGVGLGYGATYIKSSKRVEHGAQMSAGLFVSF